MVVSVPLRGFRGLQEFANATETVDQPVVSVPLRGFRGLQGPTRLGEARGDYEFQSPCGVLGVCRSVDDLRVVAAEIKRFSPLAGF